MQRFKLVSDYIPSGDQPEAIKSLVKGIKEDKKYHWFVIKDRIKLLFNYGVN